MVSDRGPGRGIGARLALALGPFLQPDGSSRPTGAGVLVIADGAGATHAADSLWAAGQPHDLSPPCPTGADGGGRRRTLQWPAVPRRRRRMARSRAEGLWYRPAAAQGA